MELGVRSLIVIQRLIARKSDHAADFNLFLDPSQSHVHFIGDELSLGLVTIFHRCKVFSEGQLSIRKLFTGEMQQGSDRVVDS